MSKAMRELAQRLQKMPLPTQYEERRYLLTVYEVLPEHVRTAIMSRFFTMLDCRAHIDAARLLMPEGFIVAEASDADPTLHFKRAIARVEPNHVNQQAWLRSKVENARCTAATLAIAIAASALNAQADEVVDDG